MSTFNVFDNAMPIDYVTPRFPSLNLPIGGAAYNSSLLFETKDIWRFTVYWALIFFGAFHTCAGIWACLMHRKISGFVWIMSIYMIFSAIQAFVSGSIVGIFIASFYRAGTFGMTTWLPFSWGAIQILFQVITSYSMMSNML